MNEWNCKIKKWGMQHLAVISRVDRAEPYALSHNGEPIQFHTAEQAELAGLRHILHLLQTEIRFAPPPQRVPEAVALQEATFGAVVSRKGKSTQVKRKKRRKFARPAEAAA